MGKRIGQKFNNIECAGYRLQFMSNQYVISQLWIVCSGLHLVTYLNVGNFFDKSTETTLHDICVQVFLRFSDSSKSSQSVSLI